MVLIHKTGVRFSYGAPKFEDIPAGMSFFYALLRGLISASFSPAGAGFHMETQTPPKIKIKMI